MNRVFLDWGKPALSTASKWLIDRFHDPGRAVCDLQDVLCVLPGNRAGRLLLGHLITQCKQRRLQLLPPPTVTPGQMIERVLEAGGALAGEVECHWAWASALKQADDEAARALLPHRPAEDDWGSWLSLARLIAGLDEQLAGARLQFTDVAERAERFSMLGQGDRWRALEHVKRVYLQILEELGLCDAHRAREQALAGLDSSKASATQVRLPTIVLIGVAELNQLQRAVISARRALATALVHAPAELSERFDEFGCVIPNAWGSADIGLTDAQIEVTDRPGDQAQAVLRTIVELGRQRIAAEITIGLGSAELAPALRQAGAWAGLSLRSGEGARLSQSPPSRALRAMSQWLRDSRFAPFAAMLRHPDIERWVWHRTREADAGVSDWLSLLDRYFADHLHERISEEWLGDDQMRERLKTVHGAVCESLSPLTQKPLTRPVGEWCQPMLDVLANLYEHDAKYAGDPVRRQKVDACTLLRDALAAFHSAPESLQPRVTAAQAIELALDAVESQAIPEELQHEQIEMLGWLELHLDDAPALIIAGFNEGDIPQSATADPFLPDSLRAALGLACNASRYARDAYLIEAMRHSRESLKVITGRRSQSGESLAPSRLLLACDPQTLVKRVQRFCGDPETNRASAAPIGLHCATAVESKFIIPALPLDMEMRETMSITEFRLYLACPYRYALEKLLGLKAFDDFGGELDAMRFGIIAHDVLCEFGRDASINASTDADRIENHLNRVLEALVPTQFGRSHLPAIAIQLARLRQRFKSFARTQANLAAEGWRIRHCELEFNGDVALDIPGEAAMPLRGKIDRIDFNEQTGIWRIIDYKTGDSVESPHKSHHVRETLPDVVPADWAWRDLQLPLYRYLVQRSTLGIEGDISLAYICLPKQADGVRVREAQWNRAYLEHAIESARGVVRTIRAKKFAINPDFDSRFDEFGRICQTSAFTEREPTEVAEQEGELAQEAAG